MPTLDPGPARTQFAIQTLTFSAAGSPHILASHHMHATLQMPTLVTLTCEKTKLPVDQANESLSKPTYHMVN